MQLSIIIPVAPDDRSWVLLLEDLLRLHEQASLADTEVIFVGGSVRVLEAIKAFLKSSVLERNQGKAAINNFLIFEDSVVYLQEGHSRATSMNAGAAISQGKFLWFVHADSRLDKSHWQALQSSLWQYPEALHYFDLQFSGTKRMKINAFGVWFRSRFLMAPFGDQAFCLAKTQFEYLGAYPEEAAYGEDHLFVWRALQQGVRLRATGVSLITSARKYEQRGWLKTTALHVYLWAKQAAPEFMKLLRQRWAKA